ILHSFTALSSASPYTNSDGGGPNDLVLSGNTLYGTAWYGGSSNHGTIFAVNTDGTGFTILHTFTEGRDGSIPFAGLIIAGNTLYGTAFKGGSSDNGTVFAVNTDGADFTTLHSFTARLPSNSFGTNSDGAYPGGELILSGNTLYGTT